MVGSSRGRFYPETESATRTCYSRDRDRIIHSSAFRRLKHKTQVFVEHEGDYYRTRLTHSLEVAQFARSLARSLKVDEDLAETVALAHDLGHTPFGHAGEDALAAVTADIGGFDHNAHALRLVTRLEHRYADFDGLNLTWETLEGLVKHNGPITAAGARARSQALTRAGRWILPAGRGSRPRSRRWPTISPMSITTWMTACGPGCSASTILNEAPLAGPHVRAVTARYGELELSRFIGEMIRTLMSALLDDLRGRNRARGWRRRGRLPRRRCGPRRRRWWRFRRPCWRNCARSRHFSSPTCTSIPASLPRWSRAKAVVTDLFEAFAADPGAAAAGLGRGCAAPATTGGVVRDYIAGMTDTYALAEYGRVFHTKIAL